MQSRYHGLCAAVVAVAILLVLSSCAVRSGPSAERDALLRLSVIAALHPAVESEIGQPVRLEVDELRASEGWAFVTAVPRSSNGKQLDYSGTSFAAEWEAGELDDWLCALLELRDGAWQVVVLEIGATDVPYVAWPDRFDAPRQLVLP